MHILRFQLYEHNITSGSSHIWFSEVYKCKFQMCNRIMYCFYLRFFFATWIFVYTFQIMLFNNITCSLSLFYFILFFALFVVRLVQWPQMDIIQTADAKMSWLEYEWSSIIRLIIPYVSQIQKRSWRIIQLNYFF